MRRCRGAPRHAGVAQLVEHYLAKVDVAGSNPVSRSTEKAEQHAKSQAPPSAGHFIGANVGQFAGQLAQFCASGGVSEPSEAVRDTAFLARSASKQCV